MKYTKERIARLLYAHEALTDHVYNIMRMADIRGSLDGIVQVTNDSLIVSVTEHWGCGGWKTKQHSIPLDFVTADSPEALSAKISAAREEKRRKELERYQEQQRVAEERKKEQELADLKRLKEKYETN